MQLFATVAAGAPDVLSAVEDFFEEGAAQTLRETDFADACPIATVALEVASTNERLRGATADVFSSWIEGAGEYFVLAGIARERARGLRVFDALAARGRVRVQPLAALDRADATRRRERGGGGRRGAPGGRGGLTPTG